MVTASHTGTSPSIGDSHPLTVVRSGSWWAIKADNLPGCHTQARRRSKIERTAREAIALWFDADEAEVGPLIISFANQN